MRQYAKAIRENRKKLGWSQKQLAEKIHSSQQAIARWENETTEPRTDNLQLLSKVLGVPLNHFLDRDTSKSDEEYIALYNSLSLEDKKRVLDYMKMLKRQETEREEFKQRK
ncbi:helix-turn-helix domain-containing protein [Tetragenococcus muriaticus]|uniref:Helix-turn-helix (HTH) domain-containing protein n=2 Tax=Tetragenococcus muriaticus TaxID=64642 RepID=A0A091C501_9ENTE|nr:helix-turn-helix transcriptional regulator [Tetragenococcus muriaticus]KFN91974.1 helix-turn-helix (HTH) domain-containing protein [Tetragenococcus muriaticus 3MR10-3]KFN92738.1 helix-turn-helix (HTH) domain-containing protein [Tetragenococcus muriaticus PMC-11-5]